ncbi:MAG: dihydrofolate reductase [Pedobacter sp.]|nr:MAG: dihydrofolate reductase [Pedobacter sp.]
MIISFVVAAAKNNVIGKEGQLPWTLSNDMKRFKNITWGMPVLMGRKTFESLGKPLQGRTNIVLTRNEQWSAPGITVVKTVEEAISIVEKMEVKELMVIGGGEIFSKLLPKADMIYLTRVDAEPDGDAFLPEIKESDWELLRRQSFPADAKNSFGYAFEDWQRK